MLSLLDAELVYYYSGEKHAESVSSHFHAISYIRRDAAERIVGVFSAHLGLPPLLGMSCLLSLRQKSRNGFEFTRFFSPEWLLLVSSRFLPSFIRPGFILLRMRFGLIVYLLENFLLRSMFSHTRCKGFEVEILCTPLFKMGVLGWWTLVCALRLSPRKAFPTFFNIVMRRLPLPSPRFIFPLSHPLSSLMWMSFVSLFLFPYVGAWTGPPFIISYKNI